MRVTAFWMNVERRGADECWPWTGYAEGGYGRVFNDGLMVGAHEMALTYFTGERRHPGLDTCHSCNNGICCNPNHLRFDTRQSNVDDMVRSERQAHGERNGHARLTEPQVVQMRERHALGATGRRLASDYGVSEGAVNMILTGARWKNAGGPTRQSHGNRKHGRYAK
jgi:hypothetical protein